MRAGGGQGDKRVAGLDPGAVDDLGLFHDADAEAGQVIVFAFVHAGHFGGLAADQEQPASSQPAPMPVTTVAATSTLSLPVA